MRHPQKYGRSLRYTFGFTLGLDLTMAVVGLVMFGDYIRDAVTSNILLTPGYPRSLSIIIVVLIAIIPITKIPLKYGNIWCYLAFTDKRAVVVQSLAQSKSFAASIPVSCRLILGFKGCHLSHAVSSKYSLGYSWFF